MSKAIELAEWLESIEAGDTLIIAAELRRLSAIEQAAQATIDRLIAERDALRKQLEQGEPVAYRHTLHMELDQKRVAFGTKPHPTDIFGHAGDDYDEEFHVTVEPLYTAPLAKRRATNQGIEMSNNAFDSWFEGTTFPIGSSKIDYAIEAWNEQQATIDKLTTERDALRKQLEQEQDLGNYEISAIIQKTEGNSMYGRDHNGWLHSLVRAGWTAHVERINNQITKESK